MERAKKTDKGKSTGKNVKKAAQEQEAQEQTTGAVQEQETPEQTQDPAPEQEAPEQDQETPEQTQDPAPEQEDPEKIEDPAPEQEAPEPDMFANLPNPCVYCGPSVKGVARQYTTYQGGIPDALRGFLKENPDALGLIVSTGKFPSMRRRLETPGTPEAKLYKAVKAGL